MTPPIGKLSDDVRIYFRHSSSSSSSSSGGGGGGGGGVSSSSFCPNEYPKTKLLQASS